MFEFLKDYKDAFDSLQSIATVIALIFGGFWTYTLFVRKRTKYPRVEVSHRVSHLPIQGDKVLLRVVMVVNNKGEALLPVRYGFVWIQQIEPWQPEFLKSISEGEDPVEPGQTQVSWPLLAERYLGGDFAYREIEPGVSDEIHSEFVIGIEVHTIMVYTYIRDEQKSRIGWETTSIYSLKADKKGGSK